MHRIIETSLVFVFLAIVSVTGCGGAPKPPPNGYFLPEDPGMVCKRGDPDTGTTPPDCYRADP